MSGCFWRSSLIMIVLLSFYVKKNESVIVGDEHRNAMHSFQHAVEKFSVTMMRGLAQFQKDAVHFLFGQSSSHRSVPVTSKPTTTAREQTTLAYGTVVRVVSTRAGERDWLLTDLADLPDGDIVVSDYTNRCIKRVTVDGRIVWTRVLNGTDKPEHVIYIPGAKKLMISTRRAHRQLNWMGLDGKMGERVFLYVRSPRDMCERSKDEVYMLDRKPDQVRGLDWRRNIYKNGKINRIDSRASYIACLQNGTVVVGAVRKNQLQSFSPNGELQWTYGTKGAGPGQVHHPRGMCAAPGGGLFLADSENYRVQLISASGRYVRDVITRADELAHPMAVELNKDGQLLVAQRNGLVKVLSVQ